MSVDASDKTEQNLRLYVNIIASFAIADATLNAILPEILTNAFGAFVDLRTVGLGDVVKFKVMPSQLFTVSKGNLYRPAC